MVLSWLMAYHVCNWPTTWQKSRADEQCNSSAWIHESGLQWYQLDASVCGQLNYVAPPLARCWDCHVHRAIQNPPRENIRPQRHGECKIIGLHLDGGCALGLLHCLQNWLGEGNWNEVVTALKWNEPSHAFLVVALPVHSPQLWCYTYLHYRAWLGRVCRGFIWIAISNAFHGLSEPVWPYLGSSAVF